MPVDRAAAANAIATFLRAIGRDPGAEAELADTGERVADAFLHDLCQGYAIDTRARLASSVLAGSGSVIVAVRDIPVVTTCPHHLMPAMGKATVAFQSAGRVVGIGALAGLVDAHARRLTLQETIGERVVDDIVAALAPSWAGCRLILSHACMIARGERAIGASVETVALRGASSAERVSAAHAALGVGR
jgi:GTP cyclohydrolase IA